MKTLIIGVIIGVLLCQIMTAFIYIGSQKDRRKTLMFSTCLITGLAWIFYWIIEGIKRIVTWMWRRVKYGYYK